MLGGAQHDDDGAIFPQEGPPVLQEFSVRDPRDLHQAVYHLGPLHVGLDKFAVLEDLIPFHSLVKVVEQVEGNIHVDARNSRPRPEGDAAGARLNLGHPDLLAVNAHVPIRQVFLLFLQQQGKLTTSDRHLFLESQVEVHEVVPILEEGLSKDLGALRTLGPISCSSSSSSSTKTTRTKAGLTRRHHQDFRAACVTAPQLVVLDLFVVGVVALLGVAV
mmetsp:Transcript_58361/g.189059  ORF Transcript_58361/g.189059 Transcript_58361/m.189059 type:complete len:218 (+) Transcript_58361:539-1192(+)